MKWNLPTLTWTLDCAPLRYPGLEFEFWLNPDIDEDDLPAWSKIENEQEQARARAKAPGWDSLFYYQVARYVREIRVPASLVAEGTEQVIRFACRKDVWDLEHAGGFDPQILQWALRQYSDQRQERLRAEVKN